MLVLKYKKLLDINDINKNTYNNRVKVEGSKPYGAISDLDHCKLHQFTCRYRRSTNRSITFAKGILHSGSIPCGLLECIACSY